MSKAAWKAKSAELPGLVSDLTYIAELRQRIEQLERENDRLKFRLKLMADAVRRDDDRRAS